MTDCFNQIFIYVFCVIADFRISLIPLFERIFSAEARGRQEGLNRIGWRYLLTGVRSGATCWRFRGDGRRCAATRRHTWGTGADVSTAYLEKRARFVMNTGNKWRVFQCTVNWSRARHNSAFIAVGTAGSSRIDAVNLMQCTSRAGTIYKVHVRA